MRQPERQKLCSRTPTAVKAEVLLRSTPRINAFGGSGGIVRGSKGPGILPIIFTYPGAPGVGNGITSTVTVTPADRTIVFTMKVPRYVPQKYVFASGPIYRTAGLLVDGLSNDIFETSAFAAFAYNPSGHGVMISGAYKEPFYGSGEDTGSKPLRYGQTTIEADGSFTTRGVSTAVFSYKLF